VTGEEDAAKLRRSQVKVSASYQARKLPHDAGVKGEAAIAGLFDIVNL
jgi:hypothetical protein